MKLWGAWALVLAGCFSVDAEYRCGSDGDCGAGGVCERTGFCSFADGACASGRRYGDAAGALSQTCVDEGDAGVPADLGAPLDQGAPLDLGPKFDLSGVNLACSLPQLLIAVTDVSNTVAGRVERLFVQPSGVTACAELSGSGQLGSPIQAAAYLAPLHRLATAGSASVDLIDPATDTITDHWGVGPSLVAIDAAPLTASGQLGVAVGFRLATASPPYLYELDLYTPGATSITQSWFASTLGLPSVLGFIGDPWDPAQLMLLDERSSNPQALERLDPFAPPATPYVAATPGDGRLSVASAPLPGGGTSFVWAAQNTYNGYYFSSAPAGDGGLPPGSGWGPIMCGGCNMIDAVPDPTDSRKEFVLCDIGGAVNSRTVYRVTTPSGAGMYNGSCVPVFAGSQLGDRMQLIHLAIASP